MIFFNPIADEIKRILKLTNRVNWEIFSKRTYRVSIIADYLYKVGHSRDVLSEAEEQVIAGLCESFILQLRTLYDLFTKAVSNSNKNELPKRFHKLINGLKSGDKKIKGIPTEISRNILKFCSHFYELKNFRDAIKDGVHFDINFKNDEYQVESKTFTQINADKKELIDYKNKLSLMVLDFSFGFYLTMQIITNKVEIE